MKLRFNRKDTDDEARTPGHGRGADVLAAAGHRRAHQARHVAAPDRNRPGPTQGGLLSRAEFQTGDCSAVVTGGGGRARFQLGKAPWISLPMTTSTGCSTTPLPREGRSGKTGS